MRRAVVAGLVAVVAAALAQAARAHAGFWDESSSTATFTAAPSFVSACPAQATLIATADATIDQLAPVQNFGSATTLTVRSHASKNARGLIGFDLPALGDCSVLSAQLRLYRKVGAAGRTLAAYRLGSAWTESSVTWDNAPAATGAPATAAIAGFSWMTVDVSEQVRGMYRSGNNGLIVEDAAEAASSAQSQTFSAAGAERPQLVLTFG